MIIRINGEEEYDIAGFSLSDCHDLAGRIELLKMETEFALNAMSKSHPDRNEYYLFIHQCKMGLKALEVRRNILKDRATLAKKFKDVSKRRLHKDDFDAILNEAMFELGWQ